MRVYKKVCMGVCMCMRRGVYEQSILFHRLLLQKRLTTERLTLAQIQKKN
jgi:hypothetical protein